MARTGEGRSRRQAGAVVLIAALSLGSAWAQSAPSTPPMPAPFSRDCQLGGEPLISASPLPNVAAALQKRKQIRILAIGASAYSGRGRPAYTDEIRSILSQAIKGLDIVMINRGVSGELAESAATRIQTQVALSEPDLVLWQVGTNDALAYVPVDEFADTVIETVRWLKRHKVDVVLVGLQFTERMERDDHYRAVRERLRRIAADENVVIVRRAEARRLVSQAAASGGGLFPEEFERSEAGYVCLAQYLARAITLGVFGGELRSRGLLQPPAEQRPN